MARQLPDAPKVPTPARDARVEKRLGVSGDELDMEAIEELALGRYEHGDRIDWDDLLYRIEVTLEIDLGEDVLSPQIKAIKRAVRKALKEAAE